MSISDGLGPSIFCRKMERTRPMMERLFISRQSRHSHFDSIIYKSSFPYLWLDLACKHLCFPPRKGIYKRNEITESQVLLLFLSTDDNVEYVSFPTFFFKTVKKEIAFPSVKGQSSINRWSLLFPWKMTTLRNKRKLVALNKESCDEHPRSNLAQKSNVLLITRRLFGSSFRG